LISTVHVIVCLFLILVVLLQQGKGADLSVFGGGGTQAAFGARGATTLLHKLTVIAFVGFIFTTMGIGLLKNTARGGSVIGDLPADSAVEEQAPEPAIEATAPEPAADAAVADDTAGDAEPEAVDAVDDGQ
jgi:preprotein translocase subunit SecG